MGKKYILELLDECNSKFKGIMVFGLTQEKQISVELIPEESMTPYTEPDMGQIRKEAYKEGREAGIKDGMCDAWEAAKKIALMDTKTSENVTGYFGLFRIMENLTPMQAIEKIRQYEQEKEEQIQVGDEVTPIETEYDDMIVTRLWKDDYDSDCIDAIGFDGRIGSFLVSRVSKTGKHYEIASVLEKIRSEQVG